MFIPPPPPPERAPTPPTRPPWPRRLGAWAGRRPWRFAAAVALSAFAVASLLPVWTAWDIGAGEVTGEPASFWVMLASATRAAGQVGTSGRLLVFLYGPEALKLAAVLGLGLAAGWCLVGRGRWQRRPPAAPRVKYPGVAGRALGLAVLTLLASCFGIPFGGLVFLPGASFAWVGEGTEYGMPLVVVGGSLLAWWAIWAAVLTARARRQAGIVRPRRWLWVAGGAAAVSCALSLWFGVLAPLHAHREWSDRVQGDIGSLYDRRPPDVTRGQWEFAVGWTWNLHGNCGIPSMSAEPGWRDGFAAELERRLAGPVSLADIEWIWDEYAAHTQYGKKYSDRYRPTRAEGFADMQPNCFGHPVK